MDLVLLQAGNETVANDAFENTFSTPESEISFDDFAPSRCIELLSYSMGMKQQVTTDVSNSARTSGRPKLSDIICTKYYDKSSVSLYKHCLSANPLDDGDPKSPTKIVLLRGTTDEMGMSKFTGILVMNLHNTIVTSIESQSNPNDLATEQLTLSFTDIQWQYVEPLTDSSVAGNQISGWSVASNRPL